MDLTARLTGVIVGPEARVAIFSDPGARVPMSLREGDALGAFRIERIDPGAVVVSGPGGLRILHPAGTDVADGIAAPPPPATTMFDDARLAGVAIGRLATQRDACVRRGLLPVSGRPAADQLRTMLQAMRETPRRSGEEGAKDAPAQQLAAAMQAGWETASRDDSGTVATPQECSAIDSLWKRDAPRYGLL